MCDSQVRPQEETWEAQENKVYYANGFRYRISRRSMTEDLVKSSVFVKRHKSQGILFLRLRKSGRVNRL